MSMTETSISEMLDPGVEQVLQDVRVSAEGDSISFADGSLDMTVNYESEGVLSAYIYGKFHSRSSASASETKWSRSDPRLEKRILEKTPRRMTIQRLPLIDKVVEPEGVFASYFGLRTFFPSNRCISVGSDSVLVTTQTVLPSMSMGFFHYTGQAGSGNPEKLLRLYSAAETPDEAVGKWERLLDYMDGEMLPFRSKILSRTFEYPRSDAIVVYLPSESWASVERLCSLLRSSLPTTLRSAFTLPFFNGVSVSWEPYLPEASAQRRSFGEHRSSAISRGYVDAIQNGLDLRRAIRSNLISANIDPMQVYRNLDSPTVFTNPAARMVIDE